MLVALIGHTYHFQQLQSTRLSLLPAHAKYLHRPFNTVSQDWHVREQVKVLETHANLGADFAQVSRISTHQAARSEERRVGKECRSRWSPKHERTKKVRSLRWRKSRERRDRGSMTAEASRP